MMVLLSDSLNSYARKKISFFKLTNCIAKVKKMYPVVGLVLRASIQPNVQFLVGPPVPHYYCRLISYR